MTNTKPVLNDMEAGSVIFTPGTKLRDIERIVILTTLKDNQYNQTATARSLGIALRTLHRKLKRYGIDGYPAAPAPAPVTPKLDRDDAIKLLLENIERMNFANIGSQKWNVSRKDLDQFIADEKVRFEGLSDRHLTNMLVINCG